MKTRLLAAMLAALLCGPAMALDIRGGGSGSVGPAGPQGPPGQDGADGAPGAPGYSPSAVTSGGGVVWVSGWDYIVSPTAYTIGGTSYTAAQTEVSLSAADDTFDRIDLIVANTDGEVVAVEGTPAASPATPEIDPATQIQLAIVYVPQDATEPPDVTSETVYAEHSGEWGTSASGNWDADNTTNPRSGSKAVRANAAAVGSYIRFNKTGGGDFAAYNSLVVYVRVETWPNNKNLLVQALNSAGTPHGAAVVIANTSFGLNTADTTSYQQLVIPASLFQANGLTTHYLRFQVGGTGGQTLSIRMDDISMQSGVQQTGFGSSSMTWKQSWSSAANYTINSVVIHNGRQYVALQNSTNVEPGTNAAVWQPTVTAISGNAATATALAANGANCSAGNYPLGVDASGAVESCTAAGGGGSSALWRPAAACDNATAAPLWDLPTSSPAVPACVTGTNTQKGVLDFANGSNLSAQLTEMYPGAFDVRIKWVTSATSGSVVWQVSTICVADAETDDPAFNTASTVTDAAKGTTLQTNDASITGVTATGCAAGELMHLKIQRDSGHASDDLAATARLIGVEITPQ